MLQSAREKLGGNNNCFSLKELWFNYLKFFQGQGKICENLIFKTKSPFGKMSGIYWFFFILDTPRFYDTVNLKKMLLLQSENVVKNNYNNIHGVQIKFEVMPCKGQWKLEVRDWQFFFKCTSNEKHPCDYTQVMLVSSSSSSSSSSFDCCSGDHSFTTLGPVWGHGCYLSHLRVPLFCTAHHLHALHRTLQHQRWPMYSR